MRRDDNDGRGSLAKKHTRWHLDAREFFRTTAARRVTILDPRAGRVAIFARCRRRRCGGGSLLLREEHACIRQKRDTKCQSARSNESTVHARRGRTRSAKQSLLVGTKKRGSRTASDRHATRHLSAIGMRPRLLLCQERMSVNDKRQDDATRGLCLSRKRGVFQELLSICFVLLAITSADRC